MRFRLTKVKFQLISIALLLTAFSMGGCLFFTNDPEPKTELEKLPPATLTGKNTFGCLVNGKAFVTPTSIDAEAEYQQGILSVGGRAYEPVYQSMSLVLVEDGTTVEQGVYDLSTNPALRCAFNFSETCYYYQEDTTEGELTITKFDKINYIISGLFEFTTVAAGCDTVKVTNGRFDIRYIP